MRTRAAGPQVQPSCPEVPGTFRSVLFALLFPVRPRCLPTRPSHSCYRKLIIFSGHPITSQSTDKGTKAQRGWQRPEPQNRGRRLRLARLEGPVRVRSCDVISRVRYLSRDGKRGAVNRGQKKFKGELTFSFFIKQG